MIKHIAQLIAHHRLIEPGATLVVAVSGGADSLCLLHVLTTLRETLGIQLHVAHLNHMLRGEASDADAEFVQSLALAWSLPVSLQSIDVAAYAAAHRLNLHDAARRVRYAWLAQLAGQIGASAVAVAQHANDQAETVLMHLLRGAGTEGLRGMPVQSALVVEPVGDTPEGQPATVSNVQLVRPLLFTTRSEIEAYCQAHQLQPRQDTTNFDTAYTRNRIRHELLPLLATYNPRIIEALGRTASISADAESVVQAALDAAWHDLAEQSPTSITFRAAAWRTLQPALQRAALRRAYALLGGSETVAWEHIEQARSLPQSGVGKRMPFPGGMWLETGYQGALILGAATASGPQLESWPVELAVPCHIELAHGWAIDTGAGICPASDRWGITLDWDLVQPPLVVRTRSPRDRMRPAGGRGSRSLQDMFVDAKVPRALRQRWPVIADSTRILWLPGIRAAEATLASATTTRHVWIRIVSPERT